MLFDKLVNIEWVCAFFTGLAMISAMFAYEFSIKIDKNVNDVTWAGKADYLAAEATALLVVSISVIFYSNFFYKFLKF